MAEQSRDAPLTRAARIEIDLEQGTATLLDRNGERLVKHPLGTAEGLRIVADAWLRAGWDAKYVYGFSWLGRPAIQLPDDLLGLQELIWSLRPDVIIETGVAHGGSTVFYASLCKLMDKGRVIGVDIEIRPHNRAALDAHPLRPLFELVEGDSVAAATVEKVRSMVRPGEKVLVLLDGLHTKAHVLAELRAYSPIVSVGSYIVAMDGIMARLEGAPRSKPGWVEDNPCSAAEAFAAENSAFVLDPPMPPFNEGFAASRPSYILGGFLRRIR